MILKVSKPLFFILLLLIIFFIAIFRQPDFNVKYFPQSRMRMLNQFQSELKNNQFDSEDYWQFRERFSPGSFTRDQENTDFLTTFKIIQVKEEITPLLFYKSDYLNSVDSLLSGNFSDQIEKLKKDYPGEILVETEKFIYIKISDSKYLFSFVDSIEKMNAVNGMFDYKTEESELIKDQLWFNVTEISI